MDKTDSSSKIESISNPLETRDLEVSALLVSTEHSGETISCYNVLKKKALGEYVDRGFKETTASSFDECKHSKAHWLTEEAQWDRALKSKQTQTLSKELA